MKNPIFSNASGLADYAAYCRWAEKRIEELEAENKRLELLRYATEKAVSALFPPSIVHIGTAHNKYKAVFPVNGHDPIRDLYRLLQQEGE